MNASKLNQLDRDVKEFKLLDEELEYVLEELKERYKIIQEDIDRLEVVFNDMHIMFFNKAYELDEYYRKKS